MVSLIGFQEGIRLLMSINLPNINFTGQVQIAGVRVAGRGCPAPVKKQACPWNPQRRPGTVLCAMTMLQATIMEFGLARAVRLSSKEAFKVITCCSKSMNSFFSGKPSEYEGPRKIEPSVFFKMTCHVFTCSCLGVSCVNSIYMLIAIQLVYDVPGFNICHSL